MASITYTIPDDKLADFKARFLAAHPVPIDVGTLQPEMSENEWIKEWGLRQFKEACDRGDKILYDKEYTKSDDVIE